MDHQDRQRAFLVATSCMFAAFAFTYGLLGLIVALAALAVAYSVAKRVGPIWGAISAPATLRLASLGFAGLTVLGGVAFGLTHFAESIAPIVEEVWVAAYALAALHTFLPESVAGLSAPFDFASSYRYLALLTALVGFLIAGISPSYAAWVAGFVYIVRASADGLFGRFDPSRLWTAGANRTVSIGILIASASMGLTWDQQSVYMPFYNFYTGYVNAWLENFSVGGHAQGLDFLPAIALTALVVWLASPRQAEVADTGIRRWLPFALVALLVVYGLLIAFGGEFGPMLFIVGALIAGYGVYRISAPGAGGTSAAPGA